MRGPPLFGGQVKDAYGLTEHQVLVTRYVAVAGAVISFLLCMLVYVSALWVRQYKQCRHIIDRVSFRLLIWAMTSELWYSFVYLVMSVKPEAYRPGGGIGPKMCISNLYFLFGTISVVNYLTTCIAINLMLTICFEINPLRAKLERWYVGLSYFLAYLIPMPSAILNHFDYDPLLDSCWINTGNTKTRFIWSILAIYLWQMIAGLISLCCVVATLIVIFRQARATKRALCSGSDLNRAVITGDGNGEKTFTFSAQLRNMGSLEQTDEQRVNGTNSPIVSDSIPITSINRKIAAPIALLERYKTWRKDSQAAAAAKRERQDSNMMNSLSDRFFGITLRVASYPLVLILINTILTVGDLTLAARGGVDSPKTYALFCIFTFFYGGRGIFFAGLIIFVDPSLTRGMKAAWAERKAARNSALAEANRGIDTTTPILAFEETLTFENQDIEPSAKVKLTSLPTVPTATFASGASFDLAAALSYFPCTPSTDAELKIQFPAAAAGSSSHHHQFPFGDRSGSIPEHDYPAYSPTDIHSTSSRRPGPAPQRGSVVSWHFAPLGRVSSQTNDPITDRRWSRVFHGVEESALPPNLTGEVDVDVSAKRKRSSVPRDPASRSGSLGLGRFQSRSTNDANVGERRPSQVVKWKEALGDWLGRDEERMTGNGELLEEEKARIVEENRKRLDDLELHL